MMETKGLTATKLRATLLVLLFMIIVAIGIGFYFGSHFLYDYAVSTTKATITATSSNGESDALSKLQRSLAAQQAVITKTNQLFADTSNYQTQVVNDLNRYASAAGLPTPSYSFSNDNSASSKTSSPDGKPTGTAGSPLDRHSPSTTGTLPSTTSTSSSTSTLTVTLQSSVSYDRLLTFISGIEQNLPKLQIDGIDLTRGTTKGQVTTAALTIQVILR